MDNMKKIKIDGKDKLMPSALLILHRKEINKAIKKRFKNYQVIHNDKHLATVLEIDDKGQCFLEENTLSDVEMDIVNYHLKQVIRDFYNKELELQNIQFHTIKKHIEQMYKKDDIVKKDTKFSLFNMSNN